MAGTEAGERCGAKAGGATDGGIGCVARCSWSKKCAICRRRTFCILSTRASPAASPAAVVAAAAPSFDRFQNVQRWSVPGRLLAPSRPA